LAKAMGQYRDPETGMYGLSQNQLRKLSGVFQAAVWEILKQGHAPRADVLIKLAEFFDESPFHLFRLAYLPDEKPEVMDELEARIASLPENLQHHVLKVALEEAERLSN
jgi:transcriptional regulator with XRE-family HTH domain